MSETDPFSGASAPLALALTVRFLLELALLVAVAILAWYLASDYWQWPTAILSVVLITTVWGVFLSPKAVIPLPKFATLAVESLLFVGAGFGLVVIGHTAPAVVGFLVWIIDRVTLEVLHK